MVLSGGLPVRDWFVKMILIYDEVLNEVTGEMTLKASRKLIHKLNLQEKAISVTTEAK